MKNIIVIIIGILFLVSLISAEVISIEPEVLEPFSIYSGESISRNITIKTDGNYLVYLSWGVEGNSSDMEGFYIDYESPIQVNKEREVQIILSAAYNFFPDSFTITLDASTEKAEEVFEKEFVQNETMEIWDLELEIDSNGTGNIIIKTFKENPGKGFGIPSLNKFFDINVSYDIEQGMNETIIRLSYTDSEVSALGIDELTLRLYFFNETLNEWQKPEGGVVIDENYVWAITTHFSLWGIFGNSIQGEIEEDTGGGGGCLTTWECSEWDECTNGNQTRNCSKVKSYCYAPKKDKPNEIQNCSIEEQEEDQEEDTEEEPTETEEDKFIWIYILCGIIVLGIISMWYKVVKKHKKEKEEENKK